MKKYLGEIIVAVAVIVFFGSSFLPAEENTGATLQFQGPNEEILKQIRQKAGLELTAEREKQLKDEVKFSID